MSWYDEVFNGAYDRFTFPLFTEERTRQEAELVKHTLKLTPADAVVDLACGHGRHANAIASEGINVTGCDNNERYLKLARRAAGPDSLARFENKDLRQLDYKEQFTAAYSLFSSFGYYDDLTNYRVLQGFAEALKPRGRFLLDMQNRELYAANNEIYQEFTEFEVDGAPAALLLNSSFDLESSRLHVSQRLHWKGTVERMSFIVRLYSLAELKWLLGQTGLQVIQTYGEIDMSAYDAQSERCIVMARKL